MINAKEEIRWRRPSERGDHRGTGHNDYHNDYQEDDNNEKIVGKKRGWGQWEAQIQNLRGMPHVGVFLKGRLTGR